LYQAIGSLLNTVATKLINDIEDLSDISADESIKLAALCAEIIKLEVLFTPSGQTSEAVPVTAVSFLTTPIHLHIKKHKCLCWLCLHLYIYDTNEMANWVIWCF